MNSRCLSAAKRLALGLSWSQHGITEILQSLRSIRMTGNGMTTEIVILERSEASLRE